MVSYVYFLWHEDSIVYIGLTENVERRIKQHTKSDKIFDRHTFFKTDYVSGMDQERDLIMMFRPKYNTYKTGRHFSKNIKTFDKPN